MGFLLEQREPLPQKDFEIIEIPGLENRFNAAAWPTTDGAIMLLAREVKNAAKEGKPDIGPLIRLKIDTRIVAVCLEDYDPVADKVVWDPEGQEILLEDPRAALLPDGAGVVLGLTAVVAEDADRIPYPAITYLNSGDEFEQIIVNQKHIVRNFGPGKNTTPLNDGTFLFRKEGDENNHRLTHFSIDENTNEARELEGIDFPSDLEWAKWRIGTAMPPIPINDSEYLMIFHGVRRENGKFIYSLGRAELVKDEKGKLAVGRVDNQPVLTRNDFRSITEELHPGEKQVVYACGGVIEGDNKTAPKILNLFVNVGDSKTVMVRFPLDALVDINKPLRNDK